MYNINLRTRVQQEIRADIQKDSENMQRQV